MALAVALVQGTCRARRVARRVRLMVRSARTAALTQASSSSWPSVSLTQAYVTVRLLRLPTSVANSHSAKPLIYKISGVWWQPMKVNACCGL